VDGPAAVVPDPLRTPRRVHPAGILIEALRSLREMAIPLVIAIVVGAGAGDSRGLVYGVIGLVIVIVTGLVRWWTTSWSLDASALHLRSGLFSRDEKVIPRERISSLDTTQGPLQRLFGVLELRVQTPGGGRHAEIALRAVTRRDAETLRRALGHAADASPAPDERLRLTPGALLLAALTAPQLTVLVPVAGGLAAAGQDVLGSVSRQTFDGLPDSAGQWLLLAAAVLALAWLLSIAGAVVTFAGFEVVRDGDRLRTRSGLFARRAATLPLSRVQGVRVVEGLLREPFGLATLRVETAGYAGQGAVTQTLFPLVRRRDAAAVIDRLVPALAGPIEHLEPPPGRARRSYLAGPLLVAAAVAIALVVVAPGAWPVMAAAVLLAAMLGELRFRAAGWRLDEGRVVLRSRHVARSTLVASRRRLQEHGTRQTPLQRRRDLADIAVAVGSRRRARVRHLEATTARRLLGLLRPS
jgi:putative membrane protein